MQEQMSQERITKEGKENIEDKKEFYLNIQELIGESKKEKVSKEPKTTEAKVFSFSVAEHIQKASGEKNLPLQPTNKQIVTPIKVEKRLIRLF